MNPVRVDEGLVSSHSYIYISSRSFSEKTHKSFFLEETWQRQEEMGK